jgi:hypothetical protein
VKPTDDTHNDADSTELSEQELLRLLANPRRRYLLHCLTQTDHPFELQTLARKTAAWEADISPETVSEEHIERVRVSLYHKHIPKLAAARFLLFDEQSEMVTFDETTSHFNVLKEVVADGGLGDIHE